MAKEFNITGTCYPESHYMVNLDDRLVQIKQLVDDGKYFYLCGWRIYQPLQHDIMEELCLFQPHIYEILVYK